MIETLDIYHFRNISHATIHFSLGKNLIWGDNGAGKSSIIEAICFLGRGRSFRTAQVHDVVMQGKDSFVLRAKLSDGTVIALEKGALKSVIKINGKVDTLAACVKRIPVVLIDSHSHRLFFSESAFRRRFIDWCAFHVEQGFLEAYRRYQKALRMRNSALKQKSGWRAWDSLMAESGSFLVQARNRVVDSLNAELDSPISYQWSLDADGYLESLESRSQVDVQSGVTSKGAHRDDFVYCDQGRLLSQGQQKVAYCRLVAAARNIVAGHKGVTLLVDDFCAELGESARSIAIEASDEGQSIVTGILERDMRALGEGVMFHVKGGLVVRE